MKGELLLLLSVAICRREVMNRSPRCRQGKSWSLPFVVVR